MTEVNLIRGQIYGNGGLKDDILRGSSDDNILYGNGGNDQLWGGIGGNDIMVGNSGADGFWWGKNDGNDTISNNGDASKDALICYDSSLSNMSAHFSFNGDLVFTSNLASNVTISNWANTDENKRMQNFVFTENGESVDYVWNGGKNCEVNLYDPQFSLLNIHKAICIDSSTATIRGTGGDDYIQGGSGNDQLWGGVGGNDTLIGGSGADQYWWGVGNSGNVVIKDDPTNSQDTLYLYNLTSSQITTAVSGNNVIISSGSNTVTIENGVNNPIGKIACIDFPAPVQQEHHLNIKFDYSMDVNGWFTDSKKSILEESAHEWTDHIIADLPSISAGTTVGVANLSSYTSRNNNGTVMMQANGYVNKVLTGNVDDIIIYVGSSIDPSNPNISGLTYTSNKSQVAGINFNIAAPDNMTDDRFSKIATHEIGHVLGLGGYDMTSYNNLETCVNGTYYFNGENAKAVNGGNPVQMWDTMHPINSYTPTVMGNGGYGSAAHSVTSMDFAMLKDIGWKVV